MIWHQENAFDQWDGRISLFNCSLLIDFLFDVLFSRLKKYFELVSPSSYHFIRDLIIAPSVLLFIILFNCSFLLLISSWTKLVSNCIEPEVELSWFSRCCIWFSRISICLFIFFLNLAPYFMDLLLLSLLHPIIDLDLHLYLLSQYLLLFFNPRPLRPKGYCRHLRLSVCPSVRLSVCLFPSSLLTQ